jgi:hypothetical protein
MVVIENRAATAPLYGFIAAREWDVLRLIGGIHSRRLPYLMPVRHRAY